MCCSHAAPTLCFVEAQQTKKFNSYNKESIQRYEDRRRLVRQTSLAAIDLASFISQIHSSDQQQQQEEEIEVPRASQFEIRVEILIASAHTHKYFTRFNEAKCIRLCCQSSSKNSNAVCEATPPEPPQTV